MCWTFVKIFDTSMIQTFTRMTGRCLWMYQNTISAMMKLQNCMTAETINLMYD